MKSGGMLIVKNTKRCTATILVLSSLLLMACGSSNEPAVKEQTNTFNADSTKDYMVAVNRPNFLHVINLSDEKIVRSCDLPSKALLGTVVMSPDNLTAYVLGGSADRIFGIDIRNCDLTFDAKFLRGNIRSKSIGSLAVSNDGKEVYTIHNSVKIMNDHYEVLDPKFVVYNTADGVGAKPARSYPAPRQINIIQTGHDGTVYLASDDIYGIDPTTGEVTIALASRSNVRPGYSDPDILTVWPLGKMTNEFYRMYSVVKYSDETKNPETAEYLWGYEKIDLLTGETEIKDFGPVEVVFFTGMIRPHHPDEYYGLLTQLNRYKISEKKMIKGIDLERTYYCINFSSDGNKVYLGGTYNDIAVYDADTLTKLGNIQLPGGDMSLGTQQVFSIHPKQLMAGH